MEPLLKGEDFAQFSEGVEEASTLSEERVVIRRFLSFVGGSADGEAPSRNDLRIPTTAVVSSLSQQEVIHSSGFYLSGDIRTSTKLDLREENDQIGQEADMLEYRGFLWRMVGAPKRVTVAGGRVFTQAVWRRV